MTVINWIGVALVFIPFVAFFLWIACTEGTKLAIGIFAATAVILAPLFAGAYLLTI